MNIAQELVLVGGDDDVGGFNGAGEGLVGGLRVQLEFEEGAIELTAVIGYYTMVAFMLNAQGIPRQPTDEPALA